jgi:hypothetical protein
MRFRKKTTFNTHDTSVSKGENGRIQVNNGVDVRCEVSVIKLGHFPQGATAEHVTTVLNKQFKTNYTVRDITYAFERMVKEDIIGVKRGGDGVDNVYYSRPSTLVRWRRAKKSAKF